MKRFIIKATLLLVVFIGINLVLFFALPKNDFDYLCEYNHKIQLLDTVSQPRIIFIGGSSVAFNNDSRMILDSLGCHIINFGLHAGIGMRIPLEDALKYIRKGDIVVLQIEYTNFINGGNGEPETLPAFMVATNWKSCRNLNFIQWQKLIQGIPRENIRHVIQLFENPKGSLDAQNKNEDFVFVKGGFNEFGDEVSHLDYPNQKYIPSGMTFSSDIDPDFMKWLCCTLRLYEKAGAQIIMMPPACIESYFKEKYHHNIKDSLVKRGFPYIVEPSSMVVNDNCMFNSGYHFNSEGVRQNTANIIRILKKSNVIHTPNTP